jgi:hypothetical protein
LRDISPANGSQDAHPDFVGTAGCGLVATAARARVAERSLASVENAAVGCIGNLPSQATVVLLDAGNDGPEQLDGFEGEAPDEAVRYFVYG